MQVKHFRIRRALKGYLVQHPNITSEEIKAQRGPTLSQGHKSGEKKREWRSYLPSSDSVLKTDSSMLLSFTWQDNRSMKK